MAPVARQKFSSSILDQLEVLTEFFRPPDNPDLYMYGVFEYEI